MKGYILGIFLATAVMNAGCSKPENPDAAADGTVGFMAGLNDREDDWNTRATRGLPIANATIRQFGVYCFQTGRAKWSAAASSARPNKMWDIPVIRNGNDWRYDSPVKWGGGDGSYFTFFGYSPRAAGIYDELDRPRGNNLEQTSEITTPGAPRLKYTTLDYVPTQIDLLVSAPVYDTYPVAKVQMKFAHALSQIRFSAWSAQNFVQVKRIEISEVKYSASLTLEGVFTPGSDKKTFSLDEINKTLSTVEANLTDLSDGGNAFFLLPQDFTGNLTAKIVVTYVANGKESQSVPYTIIQNWEKGKSYTYTLKLGGSPTEEMIVSEVTISDWVVGSTDDINTGGGSAEQI